MRSRIAVGAVGTLLCLATLAPADGSRDDLWASILRARVTEKGEVAYRTLAEFDRERLAEYLASLSTIEIRKMDRDESIAFWINAYNATVIFGVIHGGTPETLAGRARLYHWFQLELAGKRRTVDDIAGLLAPFAAADPRIHLALCNGTRSGALLRAKPYDADRLDAQLASAARRFVNDPSRNRIDVPGRRLELSRLFSWHQADFDRSAGSLARFVGPFAEHPKTRRILQRPEIETAFLGYDWSLNAAPGERPF